MADIPAMMHLFEQAKGIMRASGNMHQWTGHYPSSTLLQADIAAGHSYMCLDTTGTPVGTFAFIPGPDPTYAHIYQGTWIEPHQPYGVVHRLASTPQSHGVAAACLHYCAQRISNLRIDTHRHNTIMQHILHTHGFAYCGIIYLANGDERLAYQRINAESGL